MQLWCADMPTMHMQGKSFILNQLLQTTGGFQIGSTTRPCTKGLWMWSSPQRRLDDAGREYHMVSTPLRLQVLLSDKAARAASQALHEGLWGCCILQQWLDNVGRLHPEVDNTAGLKGCTKTSCWQCAA
jgi:hypothetical protein